MPKATPTTHSDVVVQAVQGHAAARSPLVASWARSARLHGLDPAKRRPPQRVEAAELARARARMEPMIRLAAPSLDQLFQSVGGAGCCVLLADCDGVPLDRRGAVCDDVVFEDWGLWPGAVWSEAAEGTNGIGTCLAERRAVTIHREQHFLTRNTSLSCMTAPIHDAAGALVGALDVSSCRADLTTGFASLIAQSVAEAARRIETAAFQAAHRGRRIVLVPGADPGALLAVDADDLVVGASRVARVVLGLTGDLARQPRPAADVLGQGATDGLPDAERAALVRALARAGGNVSAAARSLGLSRATLHRKLGPRAAEAATRPMCRTAATGAPCEMHPPG